MTRDHSRHPAPVGVIESATTRVLEALVECHHVSRDDTRFLRARVRAQLSVDREGHLSACDARGRALHDVTDPMTYVTMAIAAQAREIVVSERKVIRGRADMTTNPVRSRNRRTNLPTPCLGASGRAPRGILNNPEQNPSDAAVGVTGCALPGFLNRSEPITRPAAAFARMRRGWRRRALAGEIAGHRPVYLAIGDAITAPPTFRISALYLRAQQCETNT